MRSFLFVLVFWVAYTFGVKAQNIVEVGVYSVLDGWEYEGVRVQRWGYTDPYFNVSIHHYFLRNSRSFKIYGGVRGNVYFRRAGLYRTKSLITSFENGITYNLHVPKIINCIPFVGYAIQIPPFGNDDLLEHRNFRTVLINGGFLVNDFYNKRIGIKASIDLTPFSTIVREDLPYQNLNRKFRLMLNAAVRLDRN
ncbi:MAG: hypothetical protein NXI00_08655 [Cytophagales bacterium]|nr:hypothetical protein [Cytophagales bacterium]